MTHKFNKWYYLSYYVYKVSQYKINPKYHLNNFINVFFTKFKRDFITHITNLRTFYIFNTIHVTKTLNVSTILIFHQLNDLKSHQTIQITLNYMFIQKNYDFNVFGPLSVGLINEHQFLWVKFWTALWCVFFLSHSIFSFSNKFLHNWNMLLNEKVIFKCDC